MAKALHGDIKFATLQKDWNRDRAAHGTFQTGRGDCDQEVFLLEYKHPKTYPGKYSVGQHVIGARNTGTIFPRNTYENCVNYILEKDVMPKLRQIMIVHRNINELPFMPKLVLSPTTVLERNGFKATLTARANMLTLSRHPLDPSAAGGSSSSSAAPSAPSATNSTALQSSDAPVAAAANTPGPSASGAKAPRMYKCGVCHELGHNARACPRSAFGSGGSKRSRKSREAREEEEEKRRAFFSKLRAAEGDGEGGDGGDGEPPAPTPLTTHAASKRASATIQNSTAAAKKRRRQYHQTLKTQSIRWSGLRLGEVGVGQKREYDVYNSASDDDDADDKKKKKKKSRTSTNSS
jgi:hypothetical protein